MPNELKRPTNRKEQQRRAPAKEKQRERNDNQRYADAVGQLVQGMPVLGFVVFDEGFGHRFVEMQTVSSRIFAEENDAN